MEEIRKGKIATGMFVMWRLGFLRMPVYIWVENITLETNL